ncbi:aminoglycoside 6-adenylyltransferase [Fictibacillus iocasae]|uniref:Aminoglycoside 6-adenylyltransferase n=1 Tax=Fictibacillus iocasae TaxID=2715437 RepID=A0ABW2NNS3_9BACL
MRSEREMMRLIIETAKQDDRIRAIYMNGSRTNPNAPLDLFQDYDIVYVVNETHSFIADPDWILIYGDLIMIQEPEKLGMMMGREETISQTYAYLMLFSDGNRMDLTLKSVERALAEYSSDSLTIPFVDKDGILTDIPVANDSDYHVNRPSEERYHCYCNEFWWVSQNVAKGLWRDELPYAKGMFERYVRTQLDEMVSWYIGMHHDFAVSTGKLGKYFKKFLSEEHWSLYEKTYADASLKDSWNALFASIELFRPLAQDVASHLQFTYCTEADDRMTRYLKAVRNLPREADQFGEIIVK